MYTQESYDVNKFRLNNELEQILIDSEFEMQERTKSILLEMQSQTETAIIDVNQHIHNLANI